jgi:hypothetical protein
MRVTSSSGAIIDTIQIGSEEVYNFGMANLSFERCYIRADFSTIFNQKTDMLVSFITCIVVDNESLIQFIEITKSKIDLPEFITFIILKRLWKNY